MYGKCNEHRRNLLVYVAVELLVYFAVELLVYFAAELLVYFANCLKHFAKFCFYKNCIYICHIKYLYKVDL